MSRRLLLLILLGLLCRLSAHAEVKFATLKAGDTVYTDVTVLDVTATSVLFKHSTGMSNIKLRYLSPELQKQFHYDAERAAQAEKQQDFDTALYQQTVSQRAWERWLAQKAAAAAAVEAEAHSAYKLADPINGSSLLNQPSPSLALTEWYSEKPVLRPDGVTLVFFWSSQSEPCRHAIADLNNWQEKYANDLTVIGVTTEPAAQVRQMTQPEIKFPHGGDAKTNLTQAAGVSSVPSVLLIDSKGIVRYQGHPAALNEGVLEQFIGLPPVPAAAAPAAAATPPTPPVVIPFAERRLLRQKADGTP